MNISWTFLLSKLDSPIIKTLDRHSLNVKNYISSVLIIEESNFDERKVSFLDFTWHCSTAAAGLVTLDFIFNTAFYAVKWVFSPQLHFPHSSIFLTAEGNRTCKFDQILWPMLSSTKISCLTGVLNPSLLVVKPRLYHWAKLPLLKVRGNTVIYILQNHILEYFGNQQKATD